jgi:hypothetical protein
MCVGVAGVEFVASLWLRFELLRREMLTPIEYNRRDYRDDRNDYNDELFLLHPHDVRVNVRLLREFPSCFCCGRGVRACKCDGRIRNVTSDLRGDADTYLIDAGVVPTQL